MIPSFTQVRTINNYLVHDSWYPESPYYIVETVALYSIWNFFWDDEIDRAFDPGAPDDIAGNVPAANIYRDRSIAYLRYHLGLVDTATIPPPAPPTTMCSSLMTVIPRILEQCNLYQRERFCRSLELFVSATEWEQKARLSGRIPNEEEYWRWRVGTTSVDAMLDLAE